MKNLVSFIFLLTLLVSGCTQEEMLRNGTSASRGRIFTTSFEQEESRTYVEDGNLLYWTAGDQISLFDGNTLPLQYQFKGETGDNAGTFFMVNRTEGTGTSLSHNYAVYPYSEDAKIQEEGMITVTLPSEQHYAENSFGLGDNTMVAVTRNIDDVFLNFKNVGGYLKLQLYGDDVTVKSITLTGNNDEKIAGTATISAVYDQNPVVSMADSAATSITLDCGEGVKIGTSAEDATTFWMVIPPTTFEKGITIKVRDLVNGTFTQTTNKKLVIERNVVKPMAAVKAILEQDRIGIVYSSNKEDMEDWSAGLFGVDGTYLMGKQHGDNGYLMTIGNILEEKEAIVFMDESRQIREIFIDNTIIAFGEYIDGGVDVSIVNQDGIKTTEHMDFLVSTLQSRSADNHGQQVGTVNFVQNIKDITENLFKFSESTKKPNQIGIAVEVVYSFLESLNNAVRAAGGPDLLGNLEGDAGVWLDRIEGLLEIGDLKDVYKASSKAMLRANVALIYADLIATYLDTYDKNIQRDYGNSIASIADIEYLNSTLNFNLNVSGYESKYDLECGVIVKKSNLPLAPPVGRFPSLAKTKDVTQNGNYTFSIGTIEEGETYWCYPFLIEKNRMSQWVSHIGFIDIGFIADWVGPLVRYGKAVRYEVEKDLFKEALIKLYESTNGENWTRNDNWCSDLPVTHWYGVSYNKSTDTYSVYLAKNNLTGGIDLKFPEDHAVILNCSNNQLTSLNVSNSTSLIKLNCEYNQLTSLDVSGCINMKSLDCYSNQLTSLKTSGCTSLERVLCSGMQLTSLDVSGCINMKSLSCYSNQLTSLKISGCTSLERITCHNNQLTSLDTSGCASLKEISCSNNQLTSLNISGCTTLTEIDCSNNQSNSLKISDSSTLESLLLNGSSGSIIVSNCTALNRIGSGGNSLEVSACPSLSVLHCCKQKQLTSLTISDCVTMSDIYSGELTSLKISNCPALKELDCYDKDLNSNSRLLTSLEVYNCASLEFIQCNYNQLTTLKVSGCTALTKIECPNNQLTSLNLSGCTALKYLQCGGNQLKSLDLPNSLLILYCSNNQFKSLDVSICKDLTSLACSNNPLTSLDVSNLKKLESFSCNNEQLTSINAAGCSSLTGFGVNERIVVSLNLSDCTSLKNIGWYGILGVVYELTSLDVSGCTLLETLKCYSANLTSLKVSGCISLKELECGGKLSKLDVSSCKALSILDCSDNQLKSLNVSGCTVLTELDCSNNQLTTLDASNSTKLKRLICYSNKFFSVIPDWVSKVSYTNYDRRYSYHDEKVEGEWVTYYRDHGIGWWSVGEPHAGSKPDPDWKM